MFDVLKKLGMTSMIPKELLLKSLLSGLEKSHGKPITFFRLIFVNGENKQFYFEVVEIVEREGERFRLTTKYPFPDGDKLIQMIDSQLSEHKISMDSTDLIVLTFNKANQKPYSVEVAYRNDQNEKLKASYEL